MPRRKQTALRRRIKSEDLAALAELVAAGIPWRHSARHEGAKGRGDLIFLVKGFYYLSVYLTASDDIQMALELWTYLREPILGQHANYMPGSMPWAWWALEEREPRQRVEAGQCHCLNLPDCGNFPPGRLSWLGKRRDCSCAYETETEYLIRHGLLPAIPSKDL